MSFESRDRPQDGGVFDAVVRYAPGRGLRMTAIKDVVVTVRPVFDLRVDGPRFELVMWPREGEPERSAGSTSELAAKHVAFAPFALLRHRVFPPVPQGTRSGLKVRRGDEAITVEETTKTGAVLLWELDPRTLGVVSVSVSSRSGGARSTTVFFDSYREVRGRYFPERFRIRDDFGTVEIDGVLRDLDLDVDPSALDFDIEVVETFGKGSSES